MQSKCLITNISLSGLSVLAWNFLAAIWGKCKYILGLCQGGKSWNRKKKKKNGDFDLGKK